MQGRPLIGRPLINTMNLIKKTLVREGIKKNVEKFIRLNNEIRNDIETTPEIIGMLEEIGEINLDMLKVIKKTHLGILKSTRKLDTQKEIREVKIEMQKAKTDLDILEARHSYMLEEIGNIKEAIGRIRGEIHPLIDMIEEIGNLNIDIIKEAQNLDIIRKTYSYMIIIAKEFAIRELQEENPNIQIQEENLNIQQRHRIQRLIQEMQERNLAIQEEAVLEIMVKTIIIEDNIKKFNERSSDTQEKIQTIRLNLHTQETDLAGQNEELEDIITG